MPRSKKVNSIALPKSLSVIVPLYNETQRFPKNFKICQKYYRKYPNWEFIFINDGSTDQTKKLVKQAIKEYPRMKLISYSKNQGKGYALKQGFKQAGKKFSLFTDIDFSTPLSELKLFYPFIQAGADIIIGTRKVRGANITKRQPPIREWLGKRFTDLTNLWLNLNISDYTCGFKLFKTSVAKKLFSKLKINRWGFDAEILFLANQSQYRIVEIPIKWKDDKRTRVNLARDIILTLIDLWKIRYS